MVSLFRLVDRLLGRSLRAPAGRPASATFDPLRLSREGFEIRARMLLERAFAEGSGDPLPTLLQALEGSDEQLRSTAAQVLGEVAPSVQGAAARREVIQALVNALNCAPLLRDVGGGHARDMRGPLRVQAAQALGKYHDPGAVLELTEALRSPHAPIRRAAAWALGEIGAPEAVDALSDALPERDGEVREAILHALRRIDTPEAAAAIETWKQSLSKGSS